MKTTLFLAGSVSRDFEREDVPLIIKEKGGKR